MGLDMYLEARKYVGRIDWKAVPHPLPDGASFNDYTTEDFNIVKQLFPAQLTKYNDAGSHVAINVGYWRKANQIHGWFVNNVQNGEDDCKEYHVERHQLAELLDKVSQVLDGDITTAKELLPVTSGPFFGPGEYDEYYYQNLKHTKEMLTNILAIVPENDIDYSFYYSSSW